MSHAVRVAVVACLLVTAGCAGFVGQETDESGTVAPALEGTPTPTFGERLPPGVTAASVDARTLAAAHRSEVVPFSRTTTTRLRFVAANGTVLGAGLYTTKTEYVGENTRVLVRTNTTGTAPRTVGITPADTTYWGNETVSASRQVANETIELGFRRGPLPPAIRADTTGESLVFLVFSSVNLTDVEPIGTVNGRERFRLRGSGSNVSILRGFNVSLVATVDELGVVREARFAYTTTRDGQPIRVIREFRLTGQKNTTAPPPEWVETARRSAN